MNIPIPPFTPPQTSCWLVTMMHFLECYDMAVFAKCIIAETRCVHGVRKVYNRQNKVKAHPRAKTQEVCGGVKGGRGMFIEKRSKKGPFFYTK